MSTNNKNWIKVAEKGELPAERVKTVFAGKRQICLTHHKGKIGAIENICPHQGGPLGEGQIENGWVICPWHAYEYHPLTGEPPDGFDDRVQAYAVEEREDGIYICTDEEKREPTVSNQMVNVMTDWGVDTVFGMVGHSNLGFADAMHQAEKEGKLKYYGIRHEGAAAFAASGYAKLTGKPAVCFGIAGPGATNMITGMWDAHVDNVPLLALAGQVNTQVMGPGTFQEVDLNAAFSSVTRWQQTVLGAKNASDLMALAIKHAEVEHGPTALILPDEVQKLSALDPMPETPRKGRVAAPEIAPPRDELDKAITLINKSKRPCIIAGKGAIGFEHELLAFAETVEAPIVTTFKAKGIIPDDHPLVCGVLGRSGIPVASIMMGTADLLITFGASFSVHTGVADYIPTIQVDRDRMTLGKFRPVDVPLWGDIGVTINQLMDSSNFQPLSHDYVKKEVASRWKNWRTEKERRRQEQSDKGLNSATLFDVLSRTIQDDAIIAVDVGNNTYSFGRYFECKKQSVIMSGYLGSIGFAFPAAMGAWAAGTGRKVVAIAGDGGFGQYMAEFNTAVKYGMDITLILLNNSELGKITKEFRADKMDEWHTSLSNPNFAEYAKICGGDGIRVSNENELEDVLKTGMKNTGPFIVECITDSKLI
ncbi:MAG: Rieske 2Fe-2S domain-containing protein [Candidatus Marinimicrobia bacterium]|nr:Rieske 2Fe-2S domain-containing protein [Candidatus Neomarinimicrobiota bacterium]